MLEFLTYAPASDELLFADLTSTMSTTRALCNAGRYETLLLGAKTPTSEAERLVRGQ
jgi:hypothetical protein